VCTSPNCQKVLVCVDCHKSSHDKHFEGHKSHFIRIKEFFLKYSNFDSLDSIQKNLLEEAAYLRKEVESTAKYFKDYIVDERRRIEGSIEKIFDIWNGALRKSFNEIKSSIISKFTADAKEYYRRIDESLKISDSLYDNANGYLLEDLLASIESTSSPISKTRSSISKIVSINNDLEVLLTQSLADMSSFSKQRSFPFCDISMQQKVLSKSYYKLEDLLEETSSKMEFAPRVSHSQRILSPDLIEREQDVEDPYSRRSKAAGRDHYEEINQSFDFPSLSEQNYVSNDTRRMGVLSLHSSIK